MASEPEAETKVRVASASAGAECSAHASVTESVKDSIVRFMAWPPNIVAATTAAATTTVMQPRAGRKDLATICSKELGGIPRMTPELA